MEIDSDLIRRVASLISFEQTPAQVHENLLDSGYSEQEIYLAYKAAEILLQDPT